MKNCMFQYATKSHTYENTGLITREEADALFRRYRVSFIEQLKCGKNPEMVIWINCNSDSSYGEHAEYWVSDDFIVDGDFLYQRV